MLWHLQGTNTYVLGSIHATNMDPLQLLPAEETVFSNAAHVIFEFDSTEPLDLSPTQLPSGTPPPRERIPADILANAHSHLTRLGLDAGCLYTTKPGWVALQIMFTAAATAGYLPRLGVDEQLCSRAKAEAKQTDKLESRAEQMEILTTAPMDEQITFLGHISRNDAGLSEFRQMHEAWKGRDVDFFERFAAGRAALIPKTSSELMGRRNSNWIPMILERARHAAPTLFVVGALHLAGPTGLPSLLAHQGLRMVHTA